MSYSFDPLRPQNGFTTPMMRPTTSKMIVTPEPTLENISQYLMKPEYVRYNLNTLDDITSLSQPDNTGKALSPQYLATQFKTGPIINQPMLNVINEILVLEMRRVMSQNGIKEYNEFEIMNIPELKRLFGTYMFINDSSSYKDLGEYLTKEFPFELQEKKRQGFIDTNNLILIDKEMTGGRRRKNRTKKSSRRRHR
jgi:oligoribonuclease (3'-5' exoribonuclease)